MPTDHPHFPGLKIYWEKNGELPTSGAFFAQAGTHSLSYYGSKACGDVKFWRNINMNEWNRKNLVYRKYSQNCYAPKVDPLLALTTINPEKSGAYIALCQFATSDKDKALGSKFPILWIPRDCHLPSSISDLPVPEKTITPAIKLPTLPTVFPSTIFKPITTTVTLPKISPLVTPTTPTGPVGPGTVPAYTPPPEQKYTPTPDGPEFGPVAEDGWPWWVWLLILGGGTAVGAVAYKKSKQGKKGKKGKK